MALTVHGYEEANRAISEGRLQVEALIEWDGRVLPNGSRAYLTHTSHGRNWNRRAGTIKHDNGEHQIYIEWDDPQASDAYPYTTLRRIDWVEKNGGRRLEVEAKVPKIVVESYRKIKTSDLCIGQTIYLSKKNFSDPWEKEEAIVEDLFWRDNHRRAKVRFTKKGGSLVMDLPDWDNCVNDRVIHIKEDGQSAEQYEWLLWEGQFAIKLGDNVKVTSQSRGWEEKPAQATKVLPGNITVVWSGTSSKQQLNASSYILHEGGRRLWVQVPSSQAAKIDENIQFKEESSDMEFEISSVKTIDGHHGIVMLDGEIVWQSDPIVVDTSKEAKSAAFQAQDVAREHLNTKIVGLLA
jgi:hypothetical protein